MSEAQRHIVTFDASAAGERLDRALAAALPALTRSRVKALIESRRVRWPDGATIEEPSRRVKPGESFVARRPRAGAGRRLQAAGDRARRSSTRTPTCWWSTSRPGMVVHPAPGNPDNTLVNALLAHCGDSLSGIGGRAPARHRPSAGQGHVGRDGGGQERRRPTRRSSQLFAAARHRRAIYQALVWGAPEAAAGTIEAAIGRHPSTASAWPSARPAAASRPSPNTGSRSASGRRSARWPAWWEPSSRTGRTHQIRVHLAHIGYPVIGDPVYGGATRGNAAVRRASLKIIQAAGAACRGPGVSPSRDRRRDEVRLRIAARYRKACR